MNKLIQIEVAYALAGKQVVIALEVEQECNIHQAISLSGILEQYPDIDLNHQPVGVFSEVRKLQDLVKPGDRIEIYRPLHRDPKEARRQKAKEQNINSK